MLRLTKNTTIVIWRDHGFHLGGYDTWNRQSNFVQDTCSLLIIGERKEVEKYASCQYTKNEVTTGYSFRTDSCK